MGRSPCCDENGLKKGPWTPEEDQKLVDHIHKHGHASWRALPKLAGLKRCGKSCRLRWTNYLRPDIKRGKFSQDEEQTILNLHAVLGNKWSAIASHLPGRTDNEIKNFWNTHLKKKLIQMGFDPMTHQPRTDLFASLPNLMALLNLKDLLQSHQLDEHSLRLQAEALQLAKIQYIQCLLQSAAASIPCAQNPMEVVNLLSSIPTLKEAPGLNPSDLLLPQLSDPQPDPAPFMGQSAASSDEISIDNNKNNDSSDCSWLLPELMETSVSNNNVTAGEASSNSCGYGDGTSSSFWPDFIFDDSFINHISLSSA